MLATIPGIIDVTHIAGAARAAGTDRDRPDLVIEIPHGATLTSDFTALAARMQSRLPDDLVDFFHVNTDIGAPELAAAVAERVVADAPERAVTILRCRIPRTLVDTNRVLDLDRAQYQAGNVAPGMPPWITAEADLDHLRELYRRYADTVAAALSGLAPGGALLMLHTYAPRTVGVEVDLDIVQNLHRAYQPEVYVTWPERPELDVIGRTPGGARQAPAEVVAALAEEVAARGMRLGDSETYPMHPSTMGYVNALRVPGRALCLEVRRDLLVERYEPFTEARIDARRVADLAALIGRALRRLW